MLQEVVAMPAVLYFPTHIVDQLDEMCEARGYSPWQLIVYALKAQINHWDEFYQYVTKRQDKWEDPIKSEDPLFWLARVTTIHFINGYTLCARDPAAFRQLKNQAPAQWSFCPVEEPDKFDAGEWWKNFS